MKRRDIIKYLTVVPVVGSGVGGAVPFNEPMTVSASPKRDLFKEFGLRTFINAAGTFTTMTGSLMHQDVIDAINDSAKHFVMLNEVQDKVGEKIAALCHAESAMVTAGCWSALVLGTAGVLTGTDIKKVGQLPNLEGFEKTEVIVQKAHNIEYVHALTNTGITPVVIETIEELEKAISKRTAMMWFLNSNAPLGKIQHKQWIEIAKQHKIPTMIDMAADVPPVENLWKYNDLGFDLVCVSGGKAMGGPQSAGILMGRKDLIAAARLNSPPWEGNIGRGMKVNKEEIMGMYIALEKYIDHDQLAEWKMWEKRVQVIVNASRAVKGFNTEVIVPPVANHTPTIKITWEPAVINITSQSILKNLQDGNPSIEVMTGPSSITMTVFMLKPGEENIVARRVQEELFKAVRM